MVVVVVYGRVDYHEHGQSSEKQYNPEEYHNDNDYHWYGGDDSWDDDYWDYNDEDW